MRITNGYYPFSKKMHGWLVKGLAKAGLNQTECGKQVGIDQAGMSSLCTNKAKTVSRVRWLGLVRTLTGAGVSALPVADDPAQNEPEEKDALRKELQVYKEANGLTCRSIGKQFGTTGGVVERFLRGLTIATRNRALMQAGLQKHKVETKVKTGAIRRAAPKPTHQPELSTTVSLQEVVPNKLSIIPSAFAMTEAELDMREMEIITRMRSRLSVPTIVAANGISKR